MAERKTSRPATIPGTAHRPEAARHATAWSPLEVQATADWKPTESWDEEGWQYTAPLARYDSRAQDAVWAVLRTSPSYGPQLEELFGRDRHGEDFSEFLFLLVRASAQMGAIYARQLDDAVMAGVGAYRDDAQEPMRLERVAIALGALCGHSLVEPADSRKADAA